MTVAHPEKNKKRTNGSRAHIPLKNGCSAPLPRGERGASKSKEKGGEKSAAIASPTQPNKVSQSLAMTFFVFFA